MDITLDVRGAVRRIVRLLNFWSQICTAQPAGGSEGVRERGSATERANSRALAAVQGEMGHDMESVMWGDVFSNIKNHSRCRPSAGAGEYGHEKQSRLPSATPIYGVNSAHAG